MKKDEFRGIIEKLLSAIEEEDIGISLFSTFYQNEEELRFFREEDRPRVLKILKKLSDDSKHHKGILTRVIGHLERKSHEK